MICAQRTAYPLPRQASFAKNAAILRIFYFFRNFACNTKTK